LTLEELERSLPNGLHDAELIGVQVDYVRQSAVLELDIDVSTDVDAGEVYRRGRLTFAGIQFFVIDAPAAHENYVGVSPIDTGSGQPLTAPCQLPEIPEDCFLCWLFVVQWNSFVRIAARTVMHEWVDSKQTL
jgi:hypothetical protein